MPAQLCCILLAAAAGHVGESVPDSRRSGDRPAGVGLDPVEFGLDAVVDREELQFEDRDAYYGILEHLQHVDPQALQNAAAEFRRHRWSTVPAYREIAEDDFPQFVDLFLNPQDYRGKPITLRGHLMDPVIPLPVGEGAGFDRLYQAHLYDNDAQSNPATIIFTDLPPGIDLEAEMIDGVSVTGYFLKVHWYRSREGKRQLAPLILARTIEIRTPATPEWPVSQGAMLAIVLAIAAAALVVVLMVNRRDRGALSEYRRRFETEPEFDAGEIEPGH